MVFRLIIFNFWDSAKSVKEWIKSSTSSVDMMNLSPSFLISIMWGILDKFSALMVLSKLISMEFRAF